MRTDTEPILEVRGLRKWFPIRQGFIENLTSKDRRYVRAVDTISLQLSKGDILCLTGESGCGKTTTGRLLVGLTKPTDGQILLRGVDIYSKMREYRTKLQMIFQDPYASMNPRMSIANIVAEPLDVNRVSKGQADRMKRVVEAVEEVGLRPAEDFLSRYPHELSGGQRQRVSTARSLILRPEVIVADEPTSMLDASVRIEILNLLLKLRKDLDMTILFITHDLAQAKYVGDQIAMMYLGKIVESGPIEEVIQKPLHPYTEVLISNVPTTDPVDKGKRIIIKGETPNPINIPSGCRFHPRCPYAFAKCKEIEPELASITNDRKVACHLRSK